MSDMTGKINLLGLTLQEMEKFFESIGEKRFRAGQVMKWIHHFGVDDFAALPSALTAGRQTFTIALWAKTTESRTGTIYYLNPTLIGQESAGTGSGDLSITTQGGSAANIVPETAELSIIVRHPDQKTLEAIWERVLSCAQAGALATGTSMKVEISS